MVKNNYTLVDGKRENTFIIGIIFTLIISTLIYSYYNKISTYIICISFLCFLRRIRMSKITSLYSPWLFCAITFILYGLTAPIFNIFYSFLPDFVIHNGLLLYAFAGIGLSFASFIGLRSDRVIKWRLNLLPKELFVLGLVLLGFGLILMGYMISKHTSALRGDYLERAVLRQGWASTGINFVIVGLLVLFYALSSKKITFRLACFFLLVLGLSFTLLLIMGGRRHMLLLLTGIFIIFNFRIKKISQTIAIILGISFFVFLLLWQQMRSAIGSKDVHSYISPVKVETVRLVTNTEFYKNYRFIHMILSDPYFKDKRYGKTYLEVLYLLIPRVFWPDRPPPIGVQFARLTGLTGGAGRGFPAVAEGYINFGYTGILIHFFIIGMFVNWLQKKADKEGEEGGNHIDILIYALGLIYIPWVFRNTISAVTKGFLFLQIFPIWVSSVAIIIFKDSVKK